MPIYVYIQGTRQTRDKLGRFSTALDYEAEFILEEAAKFAQQEAQRNAPKDLGYGASNIHVEPIDLASGAIKSIAVVTSDKYMFVQELGRRPGRRAPHPYDLYGWASRHGFKTTKSGLYMLSRSIGRKGFAGKFFMQRAGEKAQVYIRSRLVRSDAFVRRVWSNSAF